MTSAERAFGCEHLGFAHRQSRRFAQRWQLSTDELLGPAYVGLCLGAIGLDPSLGDEPSRHLVPKGNGELVRHLRDTGLLIRISHRQRELWIKARLPLGQGLSDEEIVRQLGVPLAVWVDCWRACGQQTVPLEGAYGVNG